MTARVGAALLAAALLALPACGIRTAPRPPEDTMARAPTKLTAVREGSGEAAKVQLEWRSPGESVDGKRLIDLARFVIERRTGDAQFSAIGEVLADTGHRLRPIRQYTYTDDNPLDGDAEYRIVPYTADGQRGIPSDPAPATDAAAAVERP